MNFWSCVVSAAIAPKGFPLWGCIRWAIGAIVGLVIIATEWTTLKKGYINLKEDELSSAWLRWSVVVIFAVMALMFSGRSEDPLTGVRMLASILIFGVMTVTVTLLLKAIVRRSELNTREKL